MFFSANDGVHGQELWKSNGSRSGTVLVRNIQPRDYTGYPTSLTAVGGRLFFTAKDGLHGQELWKSNGSKSGTVLVKDIHPCSTQYGPSQLTHVRKGLFFAADDGTHGRSCGGRTAPGRAPSWSRTSTRAAQ